jgi:septal ring factor EnvC (AmiA/AmiB activator)
MKLFSSKLKLLLALCMVVGLLAACSSSPDEEQIKMLEETKTAALAAEQTLADKKQEASDLEAKCQAKKQELEKVKKEKAMVMQKLEAKKAEG